MFDVDAEGSWKLAAEIGGVHVAVGVSHSRAVEEAIAHVEAGVGEISVLVNNAGVIAAGAHIDVTTDAIWDRAIGVMQSGVFYCVRAAAGAALPRRSGSIREHLVDPRA